MFDVLTQLSETPSRNEKEAILRGLTPDQANLFKYVAWLAYDPSIDFYIKEFSQSSTHVPSITLFEALQDIQNIIAKRVFTGNQAKKHVEMNYEMLSEDDAEVFRRVIKRDLRCGISAKTVNKIWPGTIYEHPYMRCSGFSEKSLKNISFPCYSQTKMDGLYCDIIVTEDKVEYRSRNGSYLLLNSNDRDAELQEHFTGYVLMGEALALNEMGDLMERSLSNGYLNSNDIDPERVAFYLWDMVDIDSFNAGLDKTRYEDRLDELCLRHDHLDKDYLEVVDTVLCQDKDQIINHFRIKREEGEEGTVIKDLGLQWKPGTSKHQIKCKVIFDCELKVIGWKEGVGKHEGKLGALQCASSDGSLEVSVGGGFKDAERLSFLDEVEDWIEEGKVITVRGNDVITNQANPDKYAIFLPRFVELRSDKSEADSLQKIQEQVKSFTDALDMIK